MLPEFLNVDLEIESNESLDAIAQEFGDKVRVLFNGPYQEMKYLLALEIYAGVDRDPGSIIEAFCDLIEELSGKGKKAWRAAKGRRFDIGIESGTGVARPFTPLCVGLSTATLKRITALAGEVVITVYPPARKAPVKAKAKGKKK